MVTVYVDVLFLINFSVDYIVLTLTGSILHYSVKRRRELIVAILLALYSLWALLLCGSYVLLLITAFFSIVLSCIYTYQIRNIKALLRTVLLFCGLSALFAGILDVLFRILAIQVHHSESAPDGRQVLIFAALAVISSLLIRLGYKLLEPGRGVKHIKINFRLLNKVFSANMLVDNGNIVIEPLSGRRVIFLTNAYAKEKQIIEYINTNEEFIKLQRIICIETASGKKALQGYLCNEIVMSNKTVQAVIAIMNDLSKQEYDGIFPAALL